MPKVANRQLVLKPQDFFVLLVLLCRGEERVTYPELAERSGLAISAVHASLKRAIQARLLIFMDKRPVVLRPQLKEFVLYGAKYAFPAVWSTLTRGVPTGYAAPPLTAIIAPSSDPLPVWPHAKGTVRGIGLAPLYPSVPDAALRDEKLYSVLTLFDALRSGQVREKNAARDLLEPYFQ